MALASRYADPTDIAERTLAAMSAAHTAGASALVLGTMRLRCILDHHQVMSPRDLQDRIHVGGAAVEMYR